MKPALKPRKCAAPRCRKSFTPRSGLQRACSPGCALKYTRERNAAKARRESKAWTKVQREALKTKPMLLADADRAFRDYIRARDAGKPCICCGSNFGPFDAGHFLSVGSHPELRYDEDNCHLQKRSCNRGAALRKSSDRTVSARYREGLVKRIGLGRVEALERKRPMPNWTHEGLRNIRDHYKARAKELRT